MDISSTPSLTALDRRMLHLEREWQVRPAYTDDVLRERFGLTLRQYVRHLNELIDRPDAAAHDPLTVRRLRRMRAEARDRRESTAGA